MNRLFALGSLLGSIALLAHLAPLLAVEKGNPKEALQPFNSFVGKFKASGKPDKPNFDQKEVWEEVVEWGWRFKDGDAWLEMTIDKGKYFKTGVLRSADSNKFKLTLTTVDGKKLEFEGEYKDGNFVAETLDKDTKDTLRVKMSTPDEGMRFVYILTRKPEGKRTFSPMYSVAGSKDAPPVKTGAECCVTGGLGTIPVTHKGKTYYVCCSGCLDAFRDNPDKIIAEFEARKKK
jgi:hypothetical protein